MNWYANLQTESWYNVFFFFFFFQKLYVYNLLSIKDFG